MGLFDIALRNIKRNIRDYFIYFASMIFSIMIYFTFTSIQYNSQVQRAIDSNMKFSVVFKSTAVVVAVFVAIFIWYSNSFFIRKRKREVALYSLLGIRKRQIGSMLFYENLIMGIAALAVGIAAGALLSKLFIMILISLMGFSVYIRFMVPLKAVSNTAAVFSLLFILTSVYGYRLIYRFKLIDLFKAENQGEKEPKISLIYSIGSVLFIGAGYWVYIKGLRLFSIFSIFITLVLTVIGTYMLFSSLVLLLVKLSKSDRKRYFRGINMIGTSQLLYRLKASARTLATIAVLSATTLTAMGVSASFYYDLSTTLRKNYGFTYSYATNEKSVDKEVEAVISKYQQNKVIASADMNLIKVSGKWPDPIEPSSTAKESQIYFYIMSESNYGEIADVRGLRDRVSLKGVNEAAVFEHYMNFSLDYKNYVGKTIKAELSGEVHPLRIADFKAYSLPNPGMARRVVVVKDEVYNKFRNGYDFYRIRGYITDNKNDSEALTNELTALLSKRLTNDNGGNLTYSSYYSDYRAGLRFSGMTIFIGAFLGLLFLVATGSIIFFKQLSEANDDKNRYRILRNIGVTNREIRASISRQIFIVFALPLVVGIMHSLVASTLLSSLIKVNLTVPIAATTIAYTAIYMIYYFLTVDSYYGIVSSK